MYFHGKTIPTPALDIHLELLKFFPEYSEIVLIVPDSRLKEATEKLKDSPLDIQKIPLTFKGGIHCMINVVE